MGVTAFPFDAVLDVTPSTLLGNDTATAAPAKALTTTQVRALLGVYTTAQVDALLSGKSDAGHTHAYSSLTGIPATFPPSAHNQAWSTITGTPTTLAGYGITDAAASGHTHPQSDVTGLTSALAAKADLVGGLVPASQLPSFVDDVLEYANLAAFPATGETGKIYVALDTSRTYRWGGSTYVELTDSTAVWGSISGVLANQTDLASALSGKSDTGHTHAYSSLTGIPSSFAPTAHKATHATGQPDALSPSDIGAVPTARTLTINGTAFDLSADRSWTVSGGGGGISSLNGLTDATQTFQTGTTGTNFGIVSTAGVHTFNLPDASDTARGVVTTGTQAFAGTKTFNGDVRINGTLDFNSNNLFNFRLVIGFAAGASRLTFHSINANGSGWGTINSINGWSDGTSWWCKVGGGAWGFGTGVYGFTQGFYSPTANTTRLIGGVNSQVFSVSNTHTSDTSYERLALQFVTYLSARYAQLACESAGTGIANMNLVLTPKGTGALIAGPIPDGTAVGGNARGVNAIDLQTVRTAATQVASGATSVAIGGNSTASSTSGIAIGNTAASTGGGNGRSIAIGNGATASGEYAISIGPQSNSTGSGAICISNENGTASGNGSTYIGAAGGGASGTCSLALGGSAVASRTNEIAFGFRHNLFEVRPGAFLLSCKTTDANFTALAGNNIFQSAIAWTTRSGIVIQGILQVLGVKSDGSAVASYTRKVIFKNVGGTITLVQSETIGTDFEDNASTDIEITNATPFFRVKGIASETWRWSGWFGPTLELAYGT